MKPRPRTSTHPCSWSASSRSTATPAKVDVHRGPLPPPGPVAEPLYDHVCATLRGAGATVAQGVFGADMRVASVNDGPVTVLLELQAITG